MFGALCGATVPSPCSPGLPCPSPVLLALLGSWDKSDLAFSVSTARSPGGAAAGREAPAHRPGCQKPGHTASRATAGRGL